MDFQYIEVSGNGNGNPFPVVNNSDHHDDVNDAATSGNLSSVTEESVSVTSSSDSSSQLITLAMALDNVMIALEEPRGVALYVQQLLCNG